VSTSRPILRGIGRYSNEHSQQRPDAVVRAQLEDGMSAEESVELAAQEAP
jgi:hypothetical protein